MKKLTIKQVKTVAHYKMLDDLSGEIIYDFLCLDGKWNLKDVIKKLESDKIPYVNTSLEVTVTRSTYKVPLNVIRDLIEANTNETFLIQAGENPFKWFDFGVGIRCEIKQSLIDTWIIVVYDKFIKCSEIEKEKNEWCVPNKFIVTGVDIPEVVHTRIMSEYRTNETTITLNEKQEAVILP